MKILDNDLLIETIHNIKSIEKIYLTHTFGFFIFWLNLCHGEIISTVHGSTYFGKESGSNNRNIENQSFQQI